MLRNQLQKFVSSRGKSRKNSRRLRLENLEDRRLLSADFGSAFSIGPGAAGRDIATDADGNTLVLGYLGTGATVDVDPGPATVNLTQVPGGENQFVVKYDPAGNFEWVTRMGGQIASLGPRLVAGSDGAVFVTGSFVDSAVFGSTTLTSLGGEDPFVTKLDSSGNILWAKQLTSGTGNDNGNSVAVDSVGNAYVIGELHSSVTDTFITKLDPSGTKLWTKQFGSSTSVKGGGWARGYEITLDATGNVYATGKQRGTVDFDPGTATTTSTGEGFVLKLNADGDVLWAKSFAKSNGSFLSGIEPHGIAADAAGNVYSTGILGGSVDFDPGKSNFFLSGGGTATYVSSLDSSGNFRWAKSTQGTAVNGMAPSAVANAITLDSAANVYVAGGFSSIADFDPGPGTYSLASAGDEDVFVWKLDSDGNFDWATRMGGADRDYGYGIAVDASRNVYTTGYFVGPSDFDPSPTGTYTLSGSGLFVSKLVTVAGPPNQMPTITTNANLTGTQGQLYSYDVNATDPDVGDTLTYSLDTAPSGMTIDANSGIIQWTPVNSQVGANSVTVRVRDVGGLSDTQSFSIAIANVNDAPTITTSPVTTGTEGAAYTYDVDSVDPDTSDTANYSLDAAPSGMTIDSGTGVISWTPQSADVGVSNDVTVRVTDGSGAFDTQSFSVNVSAPSTNQIYVANISFNSKRGDKDWRATFEVRDQDNNPIAGVSITVTFAGIEYQGTTNSSGTYTTPWISNIGNGSHFAEVTDLVLANYDWNKDLDLEGDFDNNTFPDAWS